LRDFLFGDLTSSFLRTKFEKVAESAPTAIFYNEDGEEVERVLLEGLSRRELFQLMDSRGIERRSKRKLEEL